tara:strand:+ start:81 stop:1160 length:1080 start_codon:yes stop_codon:yes gene_type:complete
MKLKFSLIFLILFTNFNNIKLENFKKNDSIFNSKYLKTLKDFNFKVLTHTNIKNKLINPEYLSQGDTVAIVAPSGILKNYDNYILKAKELLNNWGLNVIIGENVFNDDGHFAGTDLERTFDFQNALDNKSVKAIWCARGGYGAIRVIDNLNFDKYKLNPKWIIGYSDITAIHNDLHIQKSESIHGIMCKSLDKIDVYNDESVKLLKKTLFGEKLSYEIEGNSYNIEGVTKGQLVGGNLTLLHSMLGSESSINTDGKILFIEDLGEYLYHIDRMLYSLKRAGYFDNLNGLIIGDFTDLRKNTTPFGRNLNELILEIVSEYNIPVAFDFPAGHGEKNFPMILGREIEFSVSKESTSIIFSD